MSWLRELGALVADTSQMIDASYGPEVGVEARIYRRTTNKIAEELGEVSEALSGMLGENQRKGVTHSLDDLLVELLDVASCALGGYEHLTGNQGGSLVALEARLRFTNRRLRQLQESDGLAEKGCDKCGNRRAVLAPHTGMVLCDCCNTALMIGPHECQTHAPAGSDKPTLRVVPEVPR